MEPRLSQEGQDVFEQASFAKYTFGASQSSTDMSGRAYQWGKYNTYKAMWQVKGYKSKVPAI
jgi:hypothetical protein